MGWFIAMHKRRAQQRWAPSHPHVEMGGLLTINFLGWCKWHSFTHIISYWRFKPPWPHWLFLEIFLCYICSKMRLPIVLPCSSACKCGKKLPPCFTEKTTSQFSDSRPLYSRSLFFASPNTQHSTGTHSLLWNQEVQKTLFGGPLGILLRKLAQFCRVAPTFGKQIWWLSTFQRSKEDKSPVVGNLLVAPTGYPWLRIDVRSLHLKKVVQILQNMVLSEK